MVGAYPEFFIDFYVPWVYLSNLAQSFSIQSCADQPWDFCWMHSFKSFVENLVLCGVYFYYLSEYPFNKYYQCI